MVEHIYLQEVRVIKQITKSAAGNMLHSSEVRILKDLKHPAIPIVYDLEEDENYIYLIEEFIQGESLKAFMLNHDYFSQTEIIVLGLQVCDILEYLHSVQPEPILYLDLKPDHIFMCKDGIKLIDFSIAMIGRSKGQCTGTQGFAAPEQKKGELLDERTDIYAVGALFFYLCTGRVFCDEFHENLAQHMKGYESAFCEIIKHCTALNKEQRFASVKEVKQALCEQSRTKSHLQRCSYTIAIAGQYPHIGVTYIAMAITAFFNNIGYKGIYEERTDSHVLYTLADCYKEVKEVQGIFYYKDIIGIPSYSSVIADNRDKHAIYVQDFGTFSCEMEEEFYKADLGIFVLGSMPWEYKKAQDIVQQTKSKGPFLYFFNLSETEQMRQAMKDLGLKKAYRIPYMASPFDAGRQMKKIFSCLMKKDYFKRKGGRKVEVKSAGRDKGADIRRYGE